MTLTLLDAVSASALERRVLGDRKLFTLVYVGDATPRPASDDEAQELSKALAGALALPAHAHAASKENPGACAGPAAAPHAARPAGPCSHCGVEGAL
jgi:hypothetical protein